MQLLLASSGTFSAKSPIFPGFQSDGAGDEAHRLQVSQRSPNLDNPQANGARVIAGHYHAKRNCTTEDSGKQKISVLFTLVWYPYQNAKQSAAQEDLKLALCGQPTHQLWSEG